MTNADKLRNATDEELAKIISGSCPYEVYKHYDDGIDCKDCVLEWLQSEVKE